MLLGADCYGLWVKLWEPCRDSDNFEMQYSWVYTTPSRVHAAWMDATFSASLTKTFTRHDDICASQPLVPGRCSHFLIESLGDLFISKLVFAAFVSPVLVVLRNLPCAVRAQESVMLMFKRQGYKPSLSLDTEVVLLAMMLDEVLVFGLAVPVIVPLACLAALVRLAVVQLVTGRLGMPVHKKKYAGLLRVNFVVSLLLGAAFNLWFFIDNDRKLNSVLVYIGIPLGLVFGAVGGLLWVRSRNGYKNPDVNLEMNANQVSTTIDGMSPLQHRVHQNWEASHLSSLQRQVHLNWKANQDSAY